MKAINFTTAFGVTHGYYEVFFDYDPEIVAAMKKIPGAYFSSDRGRKCWRVPERYRSRISEIAAEAQARADAKDRKLGEEMDEEFERVTGGE